MQLRRWSCTAREQLVQWESLLLIFWNIMEFSKILGYYGFPDLLFHFILEYSRIFHECYKISNSCSKISKNLRIFGNIQYSEYSRIFWIFWNNWKVVPERYCSLTLLSAHLGHAFHTGMHCCNQHLHGASISMTCAVRGSQAKWFQKVLTPSPNI